MKSKGVVAAARGVLVTLLLACIGTGSLAFEFPGPLVDAGWLAEHQNGVIVLDVRENASGFLGEPPGPGVKPDLGNLVGHIPGAVSVPWKKVVVKGEEQGVALRGMLPSSEAFTALMQKSGVGKDSAVVIAGLGSSTKDQALAARLYFTLKYFGHDNVALLDGGTAQWAKEGRILSYTPEVPATGDFTAGEAREALLAQTDSVASALQRGDVQLIDCRGEDFYLGMNYKRNFVSPEHKGHLAGAKSLPVVLLAENHPPARFHALDDIRKAAQLKGVELERPIISYCNTGVQASLGWFVFHELAGNPQARLYDGSMHAWSLTQAGSDIVALGGADRGTPADEAAGSRDVAPGGEMVAVAPRAGLRSLIDQRRDALERRHEHYFDAVSGRRLLRPPALAARDDMLADYRDRMKALYRAQRDASRLQQDAFRSLYAPWSQAFHAEAEARQLVLEMEHLDRVELFDRLSSCRLGGPWGPFGY